MFSVILPVHASIKDLDSLLFSFFALEIEYPVELIIIDSYNAFDRHQIIAKHVTRGLIRYIKMPVKTSFFQYCNYGAARAKNPYLFFLVPEVDHPEGLFLKATKNIPAANQAFVFTTHQGEKEINLLQKPWETLKNFLFCNSRERSNNAAEDIFFETQEGVCLLCRKDDFKKIGTPAYGYDYKVKGLDFIPQINNQHELNMVKSSLPYADIDRSMVNKDIDNNFETLCAKQKDLEVIFEDSISYNSLEDWKIGENFEMIKDGILKCRKSGVLQCAVKPEINISSDNYYKLHFKYKSFTKKGELYWIVRDNRIDGKLSYYKGSIAPVVMHEPCSETWKEASIVFRSFCQTSKIDLYLFLRNAQVDDQIHVKNIKLSRLLPEEACVKPDILASEKVIASLASIPSRKKVLEDVVRSLYFQVDEIRVFLNGYESVPSFLKNDRRIKVERSQVWGDDGDTGKFFWADDPPPGYRLICDDDIVYPADYAYRMIQELQKYNNKAVVGIHGILLKQPLQNYYDKNSRHVAHYRHQNTREYACHVLGTGAIAHHTEHVKLSRNDFQFRNMADIWLAKKAQEENIPLISIPRPHNWIMPQDQVVKQSIYKHSFDNILSSLNTQSIQTSVVRRMHPVTLFPPQRVKPKVVFAIKTYNRKEYLAECLGSFLATRSLDFEWVVIVADDGSTDGTLEYLEKLTIPHEFHIIKNNRRYAPGQTNTIFGLCKKIGFDYGFSVDDDMFFTKHGWDQLYINAIKSSGYSHLVHRHLVHATNLKKRDNPDFELPPPAYDTSQKCVAYGDAWFDLGTGSLFTFTPDTLKRVGYCDEKNFPIRGQWHGDYHLRCCRAGCNDMSNLFDAIGSNEYIEIQNYKADCYRCALPWGEEYKKTKNPEELNRRFAVMRDESRIYVARPASARSESRERETTLNAFFDNIYVLNLDRRPDRWERAKNSADKFGINLERFTAIDGSKPPHADEYQLYARQDYIKVPKALEISTNFELYRKYPCDMSRVAYLEKRNRSKAIGSPGAWGYLLTMIHILEDALKNEYEQILVLDDDVFFHKDLHSLFAKIIEQVPNDWLIIQLGALQYHWSEDWIKWYSENLYMCNGSSLGSHAVGMRKSVIPLVLNHCLRFDLPYDEGPLHKPKAIYPEKCLTCYPNLLIQDVSESDISDKTGQKKVMSEEKNVYKWKMYNYDVDFN
ncbi:MAG: glycosyltransferase [Desulfobacterales bacterium]|nr:glycosyltransferase [Desulfobacterales bacterium]